MSSRGRRAFLLLALLAPAPAAAQQPRERLAGWNASFGVPTGWRVLRNAGRAAALSDSLETCAVFVTASFLATAADASDELDAMFGDLHYHAAPVGAPRDTTLGERRALLLYYRGTGRAGPVETRAVVVFTAHGTGITILGLTSTPGSASLASTVVRLAASVAADAPTVNTAWLSGLAGQWHHVPARGEAGDSTAAGTAAQEEWLEFDGRETFTWRARTVVSLRAPGTPPLVAGGGDDHGTYTVVGQTLVLRGASRRRVFDMVLSGDRLRIGARTFARAAR